MDVYTVDITSWTASFRHPRLISGVQLTLEVPPLSTIMGLINAAAGHYIEFKNFFIGYYFQYGAKAIDVETIFMREINKKGELINNANQNIIKREFLFDNFLRLYISDEAVVEYFSQPVYPLLLGRSGDLATVGKIEKKKLKEIKNADNIKGQIIPFTNNYLPGTIQALPKYFTNAIPRQSLGIEPYSIINFSSPISSSVTAFRDEINGKPVDIYFHLIDMEHII